MPLLDLYRPEQEPEMYFGLWETTESKDFFDQKLTLFPSEVHEMESLSERKQLEWYSSRYLLHLMSNREIRGACLKDTYGKPYLEGFSFYISLSHSLNRTAVVASPVRVGIDIQKVVAKIERIAEKFLSEKEAKQIDENNKIQDLHFYWGAKEALYKVYGKKELDFKKHLFVEPFRCQNGRIHTSGRIQKADEIIHCKIFGFIMEPFILVIAREFEEC